MNGGNILPFCAYLYPMKHIIKISPQMSADFTAKYGTSEEPVFSLSDGKYQEYGFKAIVFAKNAVFIFQSSFRNCGGFWMPINTYNAIKKAIASQMPIDWKKALKMPMNFNNTYYQY